MNFVLNIGLWFLEDSELKKSFFFGKIVFFLSYYFINDFYYKSWRYSEFYSGLFSIVRGQLFVVIWGWRWVNLDRDSLVFRIVQKFFGQFYWGLYFILVLVQCWIFIDNFQLEKKFRREVLYRSFNRFFFLSYSFTVERGMFFSLFFVGCTFDILFILVKM